jgi:uncharacterized OB-fold protein
MSDRVPFREGLFSEKQGDVCLTGSRCSRCGRIYFPGRTLCLDCLVEDLEPIGFGREGRLYSYTVSHMASLRFGAPYYAGWVDVPEGARVFAPLLVYEGVQPDIGAKMVLIIDELWREDQKSVVGYKFRPVRR